MQQLKDEISNFLNKTKQKSTEKSELIFEFVNGAKIVLSAKDVMKAQVELCREHMISSPYSEDLL